MKRGARIGAAVAGSVAAGVAGVVAAGALRWHRATAQSVVRLLAEKGERDDGASAFLPGMVTALPAPVARYFAFAFTPGQPLIRHARIWSEGEFAARPGEWGPFTAVQDFRTTPPGFVWDATIQMMPLLRVRVRDSYLGGAGAMHGRVAGVVPVVDAEGTPEMAAAALQRYLAEAIWFPTALLPGAGVAWTPIDDTTARATITDRGHSVWVDFHFDARGAIVAASTERYREVDGVPVLTPWYTRSWGYERVQGVMVPTRASVEWRTPEGAIPYWRGRLVRFAYEFAR